MADDLGDALRAHRQLLLADQLAEYPALARGGAGTACCEAMKDDGGGLPANRSAQITRELFIASRWGTAPDPWTAREEARLPLALQDWSRFEFNSASELVLRSNIANESMDYE